MQSRPRVVFIPGFMGSRLRVRGLDHEDALRKCRDNMDFMPAYFRRPCGEGSWWRPRFAACLDFPPCASFTDPATVWGSFDMFHWVLDPAAWEEALAYGNGYDDSGDPAGRLELMRDGGLVNIVLSGRVFGLAETWMFATTWDPYRAFLARLRKSGFDVRGFPYDWRLSCITNASRLADQISRWWWPGHTPARVENNERITIIGHSLGGLIGRYFVESDQLDGARYVRQLITAGTPHLGAPEVYTHLNGLTRPFELPWYARAYGQLVELLPGVGDDEMPTHLMPLDMQRRLMRHYASVLEVMPQYPFVCLHGGRDWYSCPKEPLDVTLRDLGFHRPTRRPVRRLIADFRSGLVPPASLDCFLEQRDVGYHFIAARTLDTIFGYDRSSRAVVRVRNGDGVVPGPSAAALPHGERAKRISVRWLSKSDLESDEVQGYSVDLDPRVGGIRPIKAPYEHQDLLRIESVQDYCVQQVAAPPQARPYGPPAPSTTYAQAILERVRGVREAQKKFVVSIVRLQISGGERAPVLDYTLDRRNGKTYVRDLPGLHPDPSMEADGVRFAWIRAYMASYYGGILFLPPPCAQTVELLTWNVGRQSPDQDSRTNRAHAERQFVEWFMEQPEPWRRRVRGIELTNRSTARAWRGPSPCKPCCHELAHFLEGISPRPEAEISWLQPFVTRNPRNAHHLNITRESRDRMVTASWKIGTAPIRG
jgi:Lecithin:cholesterol acyltransferase